MHHAIRALAILILLAPSVRGEDGAASYQKTVDTVAVVFCLDRNWEISIGSGVVVSPQGYVLTAAHAISAGPVRVAFPARDKEGRVIGDIQHYYDNEKATMVEYVVVGLDIKRDLALIRPKVPRIGMRAITFGDEASPGQSVFAIGNGESVRFRYSSGAVKQVHNTSFTTTIGMTIEARVIDSTADFAPGDSGGPLMNMHGELVGINVAYVPNGVRHSISISDITGFINASLIKPTGP